MNKLCNVLSLSSIKSIILVLALSSTMVACSDSGDDDGGDQDDSTKFQPVEATVMVAPVVVQNFSTPEVPCFDNLGALTVSAYTFEDQETDVDDLDGIEPEPISVVSVVEQTSDSYQYQLEFSQPGKYRSAITCQENLDDPLVDDDLEFFDYVYIRVGEINDIEGVTELPDGHWSTTTDCQECHSLGERFDVMDMKHSFVIGACADCHMGPEI